MLDHNQILISTPQSDVDENVDKNRKPYYRPSLEEMGDLRTLTLGGSPGNGDSGTEGCEDMGPDPFLGPCP